VDGTYRAELPGRMRIDALIDGKHVFTEAFDGQEGWEWAGKGNQEAASDKATAALRHGVELPGKLAATRTRPTRTRTFSMSTQAT